MRSAAHSQCANVSRPAAVLWTYFSDQYHASPTPEGFLRSRNSVDLVPEPPRYPLAVAACWIGGCGFVDATTGGVLRAEPFYLPAVLAVAWLHGPRAGLIAAVGAAAVASVAEVATSLAAGIGILSWNFTAHALSLIHISEPTRPY